MTRSIIILSFAGIIACSTPKPTETEAVVSFIEPEQEDVPLSTVSLVQDEFTVESRKDLAEAPDVVVSEVSEVSGPEPSHFFLRRGETLAHFARWSDRSIEDVADQNSLSLDGHYAVGTPIALVLTPEQRSLLETRRDKHHQTRAAAYLQSRGSKTTEFYTVRTGDSGWKVAVERIGIPVWLLESLNPSADLSHLRPGEQLMVPVLHDTVVEAPEIVEDLQPTEQ